MSDKLELKLVPETDPILQQPTEAWDFKLDGDLTELVSAMAKVMFNPAHAGIGLSANQVGVGKSILIMGTDEKLVACINPVIHELRGEKELYLEGCLSFPDLWMHIKRPSECLVSYQTITGEWVKDELFTGIKARVFLHEFDHLLGITFDQRSSELGLRLAKQKRSKLRRQRLRATKHASLK
jgi:peptide deformylase